MMSARESMDRKRYADAAVAWETCALVHPNDPQLWYALAVARAAEGNRRSALKALERAIDTGFRDAATMERETLLKDIRADSKFRDLLARIRH
jgi:tetratricopeptide (TPR) repeat protein